MTQPDVTRNHWYDLETDELIAIAEKLMALNDREKLHGALYFLMIRHQPNRDQCQRLGEIYWKLGSPAMAGRYWYPVDATTPEVESAIAALDNSCADNPGRIYATLSLVHRTKDATSQPRFRDGGSYVSRPLDTLWLCADRVCTRIGFLDWDRDHQPDDL